MCGRGYHPCRTEREVKSILETLTTRMKNCALELHPAKTKIIYGKDDKRRGSAEVTQFDFLGFTFSIRTVRNRYTGELFDGFCPAISLKAQRKITDEIKSWKINTCLSSYIRVFRFYSFILIFNSSKCLLAIL
jgi:RNA-directed DNA polymerase